jgi:transcriptional regulator with XRE-family HTH domain
MAVMSTDLSQGNTLSAAQCRMARAALLMGVRELAAAAGVSPTTISRVERGDPLYGRTLAAIRAALEAAGVEFTNGDAPGVRLRRA